MSSFRDTLEQCHLANVPLSSYAYTWLRNMVRTMIRERLDQCVVNDVWSNVCLYPRLENHIALVFDHSTSSLDM